MSLLVWLPLNGNLNNQGLHEVTFSNENTTNLSVNASGKIGSCYQRATKQTAGRIISNAKVVLNDDFSMCCWAYVSETVGDTANGLVTNHSHADNTGCGITVKQVSSSDYRISCNTGTGSSRTYCTYYGTTNIKNSWHHLALTYSRSALKLQLWVDGKVEYTLSNYTNATNVMSGDYIMLFDWSTTHNAIDYRPACRMNDVRIYNHCLSAKEISEIAKGLVVHYRLEGNEMPNLIENGYGLKGSYGWSGGSTSDDIPANNIGIVKSFASATSKMSPIDITHTYKLELYLKATVTSGNTYPSIFPYDIDKKFIEYYMTDGFSTATKTELVQALNPGDTKIYVKDLSKWSTSSTNHYFRVAIFGYKDSTGYTYPDLTYTQDAPAFGTYSDKSNLDLTNNIITLKSAYTGVARPVGTTVCQSTEGATYWYPFGGIGVTTITDWTYKTITLSPQNYARLRYAKYFKFYAYYGARYAGIRLTDVTLTIPNTIEPDCSGYSRDGTKNGTLLISENTSRYHSSTFFDSNSTAITIGNLSTIVPEGIFTMNCWFYKKNDWSSKSWETIFGGPSGFELSLKNGSTNSPCLFAYSWNKGTYVYEMNKWNMLTMVRTASDAKFYINGNLVITGTAGTIPSGNYFIGAWSTNASQNIKAAVSDFRIYATALSQAAITELYNTAASIDKDGNMYAYSLEEIP